MEKPVLAAKVKGLLAAGPSNGAPPTPPPVQQAKPRQSDPLPEVVAAEDGTAPDPEGTSPQAAALRRRLTAYADAIPHHGIKDFGQSAKFQKVTHVPVYRIDVTTLYEGRQAVRRERPYDGGTVPPSPTINESNVDAWGYRLPLPKGFTATSDEFPLEDSQEVHDCGTCQSGGVVTCDACQGHRQVQCPRCQASGTEACGQCRGSGSITQVRTEQRQRVCQCRSGIDRAVLQTGSPCRCGGTGIVYYEHRENYQVQCIGCGGRGRITCQHCSGHCAVQCSRCTGHGCLTCPTCQGQKSLVTYMAVVRSLEPKRASEVVPATSCPEEALRGLDPGKDFDALFQHSHADLTVPITLPDEVSGLRDRITALLGKASTDTSAGRAAAFRLAVTSAKVHVLTYAFGGKRQTAWLPGKGGQVFAPDSPITDHLRGLVSRALESWNKGDRQQAESTLRDCVEMAKASPECAAVYAELRGTIPAQLLDAASRFSLARWLDGKLPGNVRAVRENPLVLAASTFLCFPVGLLLVWAHTRWPNKVKWAWTGAVAAVFFALMGVGMLGRMADRKTVAEADALWRSGDKAAAVAKYRPLLYRLADDEKPLAYGRCIEYEAEAGNTEEAKQLIQKALDKKVSLSLNGEANRLFNQMKAEREAQAKKQKGSAKESSASPASPQSAAYKQGNEEGRKYRKKLAEVAASTGNQEVLAEENLRGLDPADIARETGTQLPYAEGTANRRDWVQGYNEGLRGR